MISFIVIVFFSIIVSFSQTSADIINVPDDKPTIQEGINSSADGDTVLVSPGIYIENINFKGKKSLLLHIILLHPTLPIYQKLLLMQINMAMLLNFQIARIQHRFYRDSP